MEEWGRDAGRREAEGGEGGEGGEGREEEGGGGGGGVGGWRGMLAVSGGGLKGPGCRARVSRARVGRGRCAVRGQAGSRDGQLVVTLEKRIDAVAASEWDACAAHACGRQGGMNPFVSHDFLSVLEESGSVCRERGWLPQHVVVREATEDAAAPGGGGDAGGANQGRVVAVCPLYLKGHSQGEYVFDHGWAQAFERHGVAYYPKLQSCVPFTPATGPRIMVRDLGDARREAEVGVAVARTLADVGKQMGVSSVHVTFPTEADVEALEATGRFRRRLGVQYHWENPLVSDGENGRERRYASFADFEAHLKQKKRASVRKERKKALRNGELEIVRLTGSALAEEHWDAFWGFYMDTTDRKWGQAYLTREFFSLLGERMADQVLLVMARRVEDGRWVAGALNLIGGDTLFGRNWGCDGFHEGLHFEVCYYQAIEAALEMGLHRVEAGAQGEHKISRGYLPTLTYSAHAICVDAFDAPVADFLSREGEEVQDAVAYLMQSSPFKPDEG